MNPNLPPTMTWQQDLTGQVFDPASLTTFWAELTQGAYGTVERVEAIVEMMDGTAWQLHFEQGGTPMETELPLPRWLSGRPQRPSQINVIAQSLTIASLLNTLYDCCLSDAMLENYQAQFRQQVEGQDVAQGEER
ncbi:MAG: hypothetical protein VKJ24_15760 [Synechococcales bacterium]|nr:hypothetical protein [Synechococcales bacterium]